MKQCILSFCLSLLAWQFLVAQSNIVSAGGIATGETGIVSYSIGQVDFNTQSGIGGTLTEGVQQPFEITIISDVDETTEDLDAIVYPNPATNDIQLVLGDALSGGYSFHLYDARGSLLRYEPITDQVTRINMREYASGMYFLKITATNQGRTFKINKINR